MKPLVSIQNWLLLLFGVSACVDKLDLSLPQHVDVVVVDGTINNLAEAQVIRLNRSRSDPLTGRFGNLPITKALVEVVVDSAVVVACHETVDGSYQLPADFRGQVGHAYQLRFALSDGTRYQSSQQVMPAVPPIDRISAQFNSKSLPPNLLGGYTAGYDFFVDTKDPADQRNYYRWDWDLYERQYWCQTCTNSIYLLFKPVATIQANAFTLSTVPYEDCFAPPGYVPFHEFRYDYGCRQDCWAIIHSYFINLFDDKLTNGSQLTGRSVSQVPLYTRQHALAEIRQSSLTASAYRYFNTLQQQTQNTGGLADTPPTVPTGNVHNQANIQEKVVGYFTASAVATKRYWLDKRDAVGPSYGAYTEEGVPTLLPEELFYALNRRLPNSEPSPPGDPYIYILNGPPRPPTALCIQTDTRTPSKPDGWQD